jgi:uncharacterized protein YegL
MSRRLPIFFVLDCSESMVGDNLKNMETGLQMVVKSLRTDPHALESVYISVIAFAGVAKSLTPLIELPSFYPPRLPLGSGTSLGDALNVLMSEIDRSVVKTTAESKGDWQPIIYLFTDGRPTDDPLPALNAWNASYAKKSTLIAVGMGASVDYDILRKLTENVLTYEGSSNEDFNRFARWITASVVAQSKSVGDGRDLRGIAELDETILQLVKKPLSTSVDEACVALVGRCQKNHKPYLIKYDQLEHEKMPVLNFKLDLFRYQLSGCYPLDEQYFEWSDPRASDVKVNSNQLEGVPGCPHCGAISAFALCDCGRLFCVNGPGEAICPWCKSQLTLRAGSAEDGGLDVTRGRG